MEAPRYSSGHMPPPLVSLIMPVWRPRPEWLREAVAGALGQRGCRIELIVVDDGCPTPVADSLADVVNDRLRVLRIPHGEVSRARNAGVEAAVGDFFRFIDYDDVIVADSTAHLLALTDADSYVTYGATVICDAQLRPLSTVASRLEGFAAEACLLNRFEATIHSLLFPRSVIEATGDWEPAIRVSQDWDYVLRALDHAAVRGDRRVATYYRTHSEMNSRNVVEGVRGYGLVVERYFVRHPEQRKTRLYRQARVQVELFAAVQLATKLGSYRPALRHVRRALRTDLLATLRTFPNIGVMPLMPAVGWARGLLNRLRDRSHGVSASFDDST
jgi:glycosyltransferase involved in cell wall biosynthesis